MKKQQKKYLALYKKWLESGRIGTTGVSRDGTLSYNGMCDLFRGDKLFELLTPTYRDKHELMEEGQCDVWWGSEMDRIKSCSEEGWSSFTPLRQNIVLLMAAMNGEL